MIKKLISKSGVLLLAFWLCVPALAEPRHFGFDDEEADTLPYQNLMMEHGNSFRLSLGHDWRHVKEVKFEAQGSCNDGGRVSVYVNGSYKGQIRTDCGRRFHTIAVNEVARSIEIYHVKGPAVTILSVCAVRAERPISDIVEVSHPYYPAPTLPARDAGTWIASKAAKLVDQLRDHVDPETEYVPYLVPIKTHAGRAYAAAKANGDLSESTRAALKLLLKQIDFAAPLVEQLLKKESTFGLAVELQTLRDEIARRLI